MSKHALTVHLRPCRIGGHHRTHHFAAVGVTVEKSAEFTVLRIQPHRQQEGASAGALEHAGNAFEGARDGLLRKIFIRLEKIESLVVIPVQSGTEIFVLRVEEFCDEVQTAELVGIPAPLLRARTGLAALPHGERLLIVVGSLQGFVAVEIHPQNQVDVEVDEARDFVVLEIVVNNGLSLDVAERPLLIEDADNERGRGGRTAVFPRASLRVHNHLRGEFAAIGSGIKIDAHADGNSVAVEFHLGPAIIVDVIENLLLKLGKIIFLGRRQRIHGDFNGKVDFLSPRRGDEKKQRGDRRKKNSHDGFQFVATHNRFKIEKSAWRGKAVASLLAFLLMTAQMSARMGGDLRETGARSFAMGGAGVALRGDIWSALRNPALLDGTGSAAAVNWTPARFGLSELASSGAAWTQQLGTVGVGIGVTQFGGALYREITPAVAAGMPLGTGISAGVRAALLSLSIERYGSTVLPLIDAGASIEVHPSLIVAAAASNITQTSVNGTSTERVPVSLRLGACWQPDSSLLLQAELDKDIRWPLTTRYGLEYRPLQMLALRAGASMQPWTISGGFGVIWAGLSFDYAFRWHPDLGGTHALGIGIQP